MADKKSKNPSEVNRNDLKKINNKK